MAQITINTTAEEDAAVSKATEHYNLVNGTTLTAIQFFKFEIGQRLSAWVQRHKQREQDDRRDLYNLATIEDKASIDTILDRYRT